MKGCIVLLSHPGIDPGRIASLRLAFITFGGPLGHEDSLVSPTYVGSKSLARFCCEFLNLQHLAESAFSKSAQPNEAQSRQASRSMMRDPLNSFLWICLAW
jgi:hypothetical protein